MKRTNSVRIIGAALVMLAGLTVWGVSAPEMTMDDAGAASRAYLHSYNLPSSGVALEGYCPVAYFAVNKPVRGKPEFASGSLEQRQRISVDRQGRWPLEEGQHVTPNGDVRTSGRIRSGQPQPRFLKGTL